MSICGLCGRTTEKLFKTEIEGATLNVCENCSNLGEVIEEIRLEKPETKKHDNYEEYVDENEEQIEVIVPNYGKLVKTARERKSWKQKELANKLAIKESLLHNIESGHFEPSDEIIYKLEQFLHIKLMMTITATKPSNKQSDEKPITLGDMLKNKLKK